MCSSTLAVLRLLLFSAILKSLLHSTVLKLLLCSAVVPCSVHLRRVDNSPPFTSSSQASRFSPRSSRISPLKAPSSLKACIDLSVLHGPHFNPTESSHFLHFLI